MCPALLSNVRVAVVQHAPVFLDLEASVARACELIAEAGSGAAQLAVFPEAFLPGYPDWVWIVPNSRSAILGPLYRRLLEQSVDIPGPATDALCEAAGKAGIRVAIGVNERNAEASGGSLYNTLVHISERGEVDGIHRKLIPTGGERTVWGRGDGTTLTGVDTPFGRLGGLLCWENYMPLARQAMYDEGSRVLATPTWDSSEPWLLSMRHIAREGGLFVVNSCQALRMDDIPDEYEFKALYPEGREWINRGNSCVVAPSGKYLVEPVAEAQTILYADLDLADIPVAKRMFDASGHYARPDVFEFSVRRSG